MQWVDGRRVTTWMPVVVALGQSCTLGSSTRVPEPTQTTPSAETAASTARARASGSAEEAPATTQTTANVATVVVYSPSASTAQTSESSEEPDAVLPFRLVAQASEPLYLSSDQVGLAILGPGGWARRDDNRFVPDCLPYDSWLLSGAGRWLTVRLHAFSACPNSPQLWHLERSGWKLSRELKVHQMLTSPWRKGKTLAAEVPYRIGPPWGYTLRVLEGGHAPQPQASSHENYSGSRSACYTRLQEPRGMFAFETGEVMIVGASECPSGDHPPRVVIERWGRHGPSNVERLPLEDWRGSTAPTPDNIWLAGKLPNTDQTWLEQFDGFGWTLLPSPVSEEIVSLTWMDDARDDPSTLWLATQGGLFGVRDPIVALSAQDRPTSYALPDGCSEVTFIKYAAGALWLGCGGKLFTTDTQTEALTWPFSAMDTCPHVEAIESGGCGRNRRPDKEHQPPPRGLDFGF